MSDRRAISDQAIADELVDHLACRQSELEARGMERESARRASERRFGDARRVARELRWIWHGGRVMKRFARRMVLWGVACGLLATAVWRVGVHVPAAEVANVEAYRMHVAGAAR